MPVHDWTRVDAGLFHHVHQTWIASLSEALNAGTLPRDYFALVEQSVRGPIPDVLTLKLSPGVEEADEGSTALAVAEAPPKTRLVQRNEADIYVAKSNRITVRHRHGEVSAVVEIVSPGNKATDAEFRAFVKKSAELIEQGMHLLLIDLMPPTRRDPRGIHKAIWDQFDDELLELPPDKPLTLVSYDAGPPRVAYVEPLAVGDLLTDMPLFLRPGSYVHTPLEATYQATWDAFPAALKSLLEGPNRSTP